MSATQAAIRAGYSEKTAHSCGPRLLSFAGVKEKVAALQSDRAKSLEITAERVLKELARLAFFDPSEIVTVGKSGRITIKPTKEQTEDQRRAIQSVSETAEGTKIKFADKLRALELVGKHIGLFVERVQIEPPRPAKSMTDAELEEIARAGRSQPA
jgi:phage terminase small subunit